MKYNVDTNVQGDTLVSNVKGNRIKDKSDKSGLEAVEEIVQTANQAKVSKFLIRWDIHGTFHKDDMMSFLVNLDSIGWKKEFICAVVNTEEDYKNQELQAFTKQIFTTLGYQITLFKSECDAVCWLYSKS